MKILWRRVGMFVSEYLCLDDELDKMGVFDCVLDNDSGFSESKHGAAFGEKLRRHPKRNTRGQEI